MTPSPSSARSPGHGDRLPGVAAADRHPAVEQDAGERPTGSGPGPADRFPLESTLPRTSAVRRVDAAPDAGRARNCLCDVVGGLVVPALRLVDQAETVQHVHLAAAVAGGLGDAQCLGEVIGGLLVPALHSVDVAEAGQGVDLADGVADGSGDSQRLAEVVAGLIEVYATRAGRHGQSRLFVSRAIRANGHCDFTGAELARSFDDLVSWVRTGHRPAGDAILDRRVVARDDFGCQFTVGVRADFVAPACP
jgi:hypothetical protein